MATDVPDLDKIHDRCNDQIAALQRELEQAREERDTAVLHADMLESVTVSMRALRAEQRLEAAESERDGLRALAELAEEEWGGDEDNFIEQDGLFEYCTVCRAHQDISRAKPPFPHKPDCRKVRFDALKEGEARIQSGESK